MARDVHCTQSEHNQDTNNQRGSEQPIPGCVCGFSGHPQLLSEFLQFWIYHRQYGSYVEPDLKWYCRRTARRAARPRHMDTISPEIIAPVVREKEGSEASARSRAGQIPGHGGTSASEEQARATRRQA